MTFPEKIKYAFLWFIRIMINKIPTIHKKEHYDLVILKVCLIGDFIMEYDPMVDMMKTFKGKKVLLICPNLIMPFVSDDVFFTGIIGYDFKKVLSISYWYKLSSKLKRISSDIVYYSAWERYPEGDLIVNAIKSKELVGMKLIKGKSFINSCFDKQYTRLLEFPSEENEIKQMEFFARNTYNPQYEYGHNPLPVKKIRFDEICSPFVIISVSSSIEKKMWPLKKFAELIKALPKKLTIVITGAGNDDLKRAKELIELVDNREIINFVNKTSLVELASLISQSLFVVGNDSSAVHIAAATRVPSICVLHGAHFNRFFPYPKGLLEEKYTPRSVYYKMSCYKCYYKCIYGDLTPFKCLSMVSVDAVLDEVKIILKDYYPKIALG